MKFRKLTIENYKSFQFATELAFPVAEDGRSIVLIGGMNGAGKTSIMEAINYCLYGGKVDDIYRNINRREKAKGNANVCFELTVEMDDLSELMVRRSWTAGATSDPKSRDLTERLVVVRDGKCVSVQNQAIWQDFIRAAIPRGITQFFFFDGEKIQEIAADDHSEVRLKSSLEDALGIQYINRLGADIGAIKHEERKGFIEISDEDLEFKESEHRRDRRVARVADRRARGTPVADRPLPDPARAERIVVVGLLRTTSARRGLRPHPGALADDPAHRPGVPARGPCGGAPDAALPGVGVLRGGPQRRALAPEPIATADAAPHS